MKIPAIITEIKTLGGLLWLTPVAIFLVVNFYLLNEMKNDYIWDTKFAKKVMEIYFAPWSSWWGIFLLSEDFRQGTIETTLTYPISRWVLGPIRVLRNLAIFFILQYLTAQVLAVGGTKINITSLLLESLPVSFLFAALGLISIIIMKNSFLSLAVVFSYWAVEAVTGGSLTGRFYVFMGTDNRPELIPLYLNRLSLIIIGILFLLLCVKLLKSENLFK